MAPEIHVVAAILYNPQNKILITKRPDALHLGGYWEFPGGKIKNSESHKSALIREIKEETALDIEVKELFWKEFVTYPEKSVHLYFYTAQLLTEKEIVMHEIADYRWLYPRQLIEYRFPKGDERVIEKLVNTV